MRLRYFHRPHRRWEVTPRGHPVPDLVQVALQILLERLDRAPVHTRRPSIGLDLLVRLPNLPPGDRKRLVLRRRLAHSTPPGAFPVARTNSPKWPGPLAPPRLPGLPRYYRPVRQQTPRRYSAPHGFRRLRALPVAAHTPAAGSVGACLPTFYARAADRARVAYMPGTAWPVAGYPPDSSWSLVRAPVLMPSQTNFDTSIAIRLRSPSRSPPDASGAPFPHRSPRRSSANAA